MRQVCLPAIISFIAPFVLGACASSPLPTIDQVSLDAFTALEGLDEELAEVLTDNTPVPSRHTGQVRIQIKAWALWSGDGPKPTIRLGRSKEKEGELFAQWHFKGEKGLAESRQGQIFKQRSSVFSGNDPVSNPVASDSFVIGPSGQNLEISLRVFDKDRLGDQRKGELKRFLEEVGSGAANLYPGGEGSIPVIGELFTLLAFDLPNLFLDNEAIGTVRFTIIRDKDGVLIENMTRKDNFLVAHLSMEPR